VTHRQSRDGLVAGSGCPELRAPVSRLTSRRRKPVVECWSDMAASIGVVV
jgi:hypothetical protein